MRFLAMVLLLVAGLPRVVAAATFTVDTVVDDPTKSDCDELVAADCSLRGAIASANADPAFDQIRVPPGTYDLSVSAPCTFIAARGENFSGSTTTLCVNGDLEILGAGALSTVLQSSGADRILAISAGKTVAISAVTLLGGVASPGFGFQIGGGGAILNHGVLTLAGSTLVGNQTAGGGGGAIYNRGILQIVSSVVTGNSTAGPGGAVWNNADAGGGVLEILESTISDNAASDGGGLFLNGFAPAPSGVVTITGSTISGNTARNIGGGIANSAYSTVTLVDATISGNTAWTGGGIENGSSSPAGSATVHLANVTVTNNTALSGAGGGIVNNPLETVLARNSILAGNHASAAGPDCLAFGADNTLVSGGHNLIGTASECVVTGDATGNLTGVDARLGVLAENGGSTRTHALLEADDGLPASPALDAGDPAPPGSGGSACAATDQRGVLRPIEAACDIGAFERVAMLAVRHVTPNHGGNAGPLVATVVGDGFGPEATVKLTRAGEADIPGEPVEPDTGGSNLATTFDLAGRGTGSWSVEVTEAGEAPVTLADAFTIEQAGTPQLWAEVVGVNRVRAGRPALFSVVYGNRGNVDALGIPLVLAVTPAYSFRASFPTTDPPAIPGQAFHDFSGVSEFVETGPGGLLDIPLFLPIVPAGSTGTLEFIMSVPAGAQEGDELTLVAKIGTVPWYTPAGTPDPDHVTDHAAAAIGYAARLLGAPIPPALENGIAAYADDQLAAVGAGGRAELIANLGRPRSVYNLSHLVIDVAAFAVTQATMAKATPLGDEGTFAERVFALASSFVGPSDAQATCPPCICGVPVVEGCSCGRDCVPPGPPSKPPPGDPLGGITPGQCRDLPRHRVSSDGKLCIPDGAKDCAIFQNPLYLDPDCVRVPIQRSVDPNDKSAPLGSGPGHAVDGRTPLSYAISFENLPAATAPAQEVTITDALDSAAFDLSTFGFGPIDIAGIVQILPPPGSSDFTGGADLRPAVDILVTVDAHLDPATGTATWKFRSIDPATGQLTDDVDAGFLPPNVDPPEGEGRVFFSVSPKGTLATGTEIRNRATIVFDVNAPIDTPEVLNTIDGTAPASAVTSLEAASACATSLTVRWAGTDAGSSIADFTVLVSVDGRPAEIWQEGTAETSAVYEGEVGHRYAFWSVASDAVGNVEAAPSVPDVEHEVAACGSERDLAVTRVKVPKVVKLRDAKPSATATVIVRVQNRGRSPESIRDVATLASLVQLEIDSLGSCADPVVRFLPPKSFKPLVLEPLRKLKLAFEATLDCANDAAKGAGRADYAVTATLDAAALGAADAHAADDVCPRDVSPPGVVDPFPAKRLVDKGCGPKKLDKTFGGPILIDVTSAPAP